MSEEEVDRVEKRYNETEKSRLFSLGFMKKENRGFWLKEHQLGDVVEMETDDLMPFSCGF